MTKTTPDNEQLLKSYKLVNETFNALRNSKTYREMKMSMNENELFVLSSLRKERAITNHLLNKSNGTVNTARSGRNQTKT